MFVSSSMISYNISSRIFSNDKETTTFLQHFRLVLSRFVLFRELFSVQRTFVRLTSSLICFVSDISRWQPKRTRGSFVFYVCDKGLHHDVMSRRKQGSSRVSCYRVTPIFKYTTEIYRNTRRIHLSLEIMTDHNFIEWFLVNGQFCSGLLIGCSPANAVPGITCYLLLL